MELKGLNKFPPVTKIPHILHGGDYNPDQWLNYPQVLQEDVRLMKLAGINSASIAIFAWKALEPEEGVYTFEWLDETMDRLYENGVSVILATPSGARPAWMDQKYPEVLRVNEYGVRNYHGERHNHCYTSPYYRKKVFEMNTMLAQRYKDHPALTMWHLSNEYGGECHCELCQQAFRDWLREKYHNNIDELNEQWWTYFWSHKFSSFDEIDAPSHRGEFQIHGMNLDWKRFVTYQTTEFMKNEIAAVKAVTPDIPVVTNLMGTYPGLDPWKMADALDVISWDNYPEWHNPQSPSRTASDIAFVHDINRSLKQGRPFMLMESTPSMVNWKPVNKLKRPGMHILSSMQAVAHGSDTVQYFQWRKGRGASEKFHGAVVDHSGHEHTRVFDEVSRLGEILKELDPIVGTSVKPDVAVIYDWENKWAIDDLQGLNTQRNYEETCKTHYFSFWKRGIPADVISMDCDFSGYKLVVAPMLYMLKPTVGPRLKKFVEEGGKLVLTYVSGYVNENDLCFLGGFPGDGLMDVAGVWAEEIDSLYPEDTNAIVFGDNSLGMTGTYECGTYCELIHAKGGCEVLATYKNDFYSGQPAVTKNRFGLGTCYYLATRTTSEMLDDFYAKVIREAGIESCTEHRLPQGVSIQPRGGNGEEYLFVMNFENRGTDIPLKRGKRYVDLITGSDVAEQVFLRGYGVAVLKEL